jgi:hypothetical protein
MNRASLCIIAALIAAVGYCSWVIKRQYVESGMQKAQIGQLQADAEAAQEQRKLAGLVLAHRAQENASAARKQAAVRLSVDRAMAKNTDWANATVPQEVLDALE